MCETRRWKKEGKQPHKEIIGIALQGTMSQWGLWAVAEARVYSTQAVMRCFKLLFISIGFCGIISL